MNTDYISKVMIITQFADCEGCAYVTVDEICNLDQKITLTPEVVADLYRAARACEALTAEENGVLAHFELSPDFTGAKLYVSLYVHASDSMDYHMAVYEPLRKALYTEDDYRAAETEITRKCYPITEE